MNMTLQDLKDAISEAEKLGFPPSARVCLHQPDAKAMCDVLSPLRHSEPRKHQVFIREDGPLEKQSYREKMLVLSPCVGGVLDRK